MTAQPPARTNLNVYLIDDHPVVGLGLSMALQGHSRFRLAGTSTSPTTGLEAVAATRPDVVIIDLVFDGTLEPDIIRECRVLLPDALILAFTSLPRRAYEREMLDAGANAFLGKNTDMATLVETITTMVGLPRVVEPAEPLSRERERQVDGVHLTRREAEVARRLGQGLSIAQISQSLAISANTVAVHRDNIRKKLRCRNMTELVALLARQGVER